jgi:integrase
VFLSFADNKNDNTMQYLPNGCKASNLLVYPKNWKRNAKFLLKENWRITYRFYDPKYENTSLWGKTITVRRMNEFKVLSQRQQATETIIKDELHILFHEGYNPIDNTYSNFNEAFSEDMPICKAIEYAYSKVECAKKTKDEIKWLKDYFIESTKMIGYDYYLVSEIKRKHVRTILNHLAKRKNYSNSRYNKVRNYMQIVFKRLVVEDLIEINPIDAIEKKKVIKKLRRAVTDTNHEIIRNHLKENYYTFYRYLEIFYRSGSRTSELLRIKKEDVNIKAQTFKITVLKNNTPTEELKAINNNVLHFWSEIIENSEKGNYLFSQNLSPGEKQIRSEQITRRWKTHVKNKLGINEDFYSFKHKYLTKVVDLKGRNLASGIAGHTSNKMLDNHYDLNNKQRIIEYGKRINVV